LALQALARLGTRLRINENAVMALMRVVQVRQAGGPLELRQREIPVPASGQVRLKVQACGICHSDSYTKQGTFPGVQLPRVPGHEVIGLIDALGSGVPGWREGQRVGVGWHGGHCGHCISCRRGDFITCATGQIPGISFDGGYAEYMVVPFSVLALVPDALTSAAAAPLMCAGVTTFNSLRHSGAVAGDLVGVIGIGGLGHLGVQYAAKMGYRTAAIARGQDKEALARKLGADYYIDSTTQDVAGELSKLGGAKVILTTATSGKAASVALAGLGIDGTLIVLGAAQDPIEVPPMRIIGHRKAVKGWPSGTAMDSQDTMNFSAATGIAPMIETMPLERAAEAYERMMSGAARFRMVLTISE
jgi:D-arabinose 1-dehydrogenase-like Zn-dependent alcohol dehydrogenase